jgi:hypothetical protein
MTPTLSEMIANHKRIIPCLENKSLALYRGPGTHFWESLRAEDGTEPVAIVDIIIIDVGTGVIAGYPRIVVVVRL